MTYTLNGKQYLVIAPGPRQLSTKQGDSVPPSPSPSPVPVAYTSVCATAAAPRLIPLGHVILRRVGSVHFSVRHRCPHLD